MDLRDHIRDIPDFPKKGIIFKDITPLLKDGHALREAVTQLANPFRDCGIDTVVGIEARGFIFASAVALELGAGFVPVRKPGKLPAATIRQSYALEYGEDAVEMHRDALHEGSRVLLVDDLLATGGTAQAAIRLAERAGATVNAAAFLVELEFLKGRSKLEGHEVFSIIKY